MAAATSSGSMRRRCGFIPTTLFTISSRGRPVTRTMFSTLSSVIGVST